MQSAAALAAEKNSHIRNELRPVILDLPMKTHPAASTAIAQQDWSLRGVNPKQSIYRISFDAATTANSRLSARRIIDTVSAALFSRTGFSDSFSIRIRRRKFTAITPQSSKNPCLA